MIKPGRPLKTGIASELQRQVSRPARMYLKLTLNESSDHPPLVGSASYMFGSDNKPKVGSPSWDSLIKFHPLWHSMNLSPWANANTQWQGALTRTGDWCIFPDKLLCVQNRGEINLLTGRRGNSESCREEQGWAKMEFVEFGHDISVAGAMLCHIGHIILIYTEGMSFI